MHRMYWLTPVLLALVIVAFSVAALAITEEEAKQVFEKAGCATCHSTPGNDFKSLVDKIRSWASKYASLDEAVANEYKQAQTYDQLMQQMKQYTPSISDEDYQLLYQFFKQVFEEAKGGAGVTESEAKQVFEKAGCATCHNAPGNNFDSIVEKIRSWAEKYGSLDEAVASEYPQAKSYDELMQQMKQYTPGISDKDYQLLYQFFKQVFEEAKGGQAAAATPTTTTAQVSEATTTTTTTPKENITTLPSVPTPNPSEEARSRISTGLVVGVAILVVAVVLFVVFRLKK
ncbi:c-type cytochrome [Pyrolobus fumarii]|nr:c-type cytochrome [Pyrolobus fumarii]